MNEFELLEQLVALADEAGLEVRPIRGGAGAEGEPVASSAVCRVRGETWIVLSSADSVDERVAVVASALRSHARDWLDGRWLPPAIRECVLPEDD